MAVCLYASFLVPVAASSSSSSSKHKGKVGKISKHVPAIGNGTTPTVQEVAPVFNLIIAATNKDDKPSELPILPSAQISNQAPIIEDEATPTNQGSVVARITLSEKVNKTKPSSSSSSKGGEVDKVVTRMPSAEKSNQMPNTKHDATPTTQGSNAARMISNSTAAATNKGGEPPVVPNKGGEVDEVVPSVPAAKESGERPAKIQRQSGVQSTNPAPAPGLRAPPNFEDESDINGGIPMNEDEGVLDDYHPHNQENETYQNKLPPTSIRLASRKQGADRDWEKYREVWRAALKRKFPQGKKAMPFKRSENDPTGEKNWGSFMSCFTE